ncbi:MAG: hypothetical protein VCC99_16425 [Alphaproteobacteria bacterium]
MRRTRIAARLALFLVSALAVAACSSGGSLNPFADSVVLPCPYVRVLADARLYRRYSPGPVADASTLELEAKIVTAEFGCEYDDSDDPKSAMELDLTLVIAAQRGPAAVAADSERVPYFVALVGPRRDVVNKQTFELLIPFSEPGQRVALTEPEEVTLFFPAAGAIAPWEYSVVVGFQLTAEQLRQARNPAPVAPAPVAPDSE